MDDQKKFVEMLGEIVDIAATNNNSITTAEIDEYFCDMELSKAQLEYVYDYICKGGISVRGYVSSISKESKDMSEDYSVADDNRSDSDSGIPSSARLKHYRKSVRQMSVADDDELEIAYNCLLCGSAQEKDMHIVIESHLSTVMNICSKYTGRGVSSDELIEEGNMALVVAVNELSNDENIKKEETSKAGEICEKYIRDRIRAGIIEYIDDVNERETALYATVAKAGLVNEAVKTLAQEYGRIATLEELSRYTHIPVDEIEDIVKLSAGSIEIGKE